MNIEETRQAYAKTLDTAKAFLADHKQADGTLSAEDDAKYASLEETLTKLKAQVVREEKLEKMEEEISVMDKKQAAKVLTSTPESPIAAEETKVSDYATAFTDALKSGFRAITDDLNEGVDSEGGYLVPEELDSRLIEKLEEGTVMRQLATVITTTGTHKINIAGDQPDAAWADEGEKVDWGTGTFDQITLDAYKLQVGIRVTDELLQDNAFNLETYITDTFAQKLAAAEEDAFLNGAADAKTPTGVFTAGTQAATTSELTGDDILTLIYALKRPYRSNAAFIMNDKTLLAVRELKDKNDQYLWQPSYQEGEPARILGYPVYTSGSAPEDAIAFGDFSYYNIADRQGRTMLALRERFADEGYVGYIARERVDGNLTLPEAVQILAIG